MLTIIDRKKWGRISDRVYLIWRWIVVSMVPSYGKSALMAMILISVGHFMKAGSVVVAVKVISKGMMGEPFLRYQISDPLFSAGLFLFITMMIGLMVGYYGHRLAVSTVINYEGTSFAQGICIARLIQVRDAKNQENKIKELIMTAPRFMSRGMLQILNSATSTVLTIVGFLVCLHLYPLLTLSIVIILILSCPLYIWASIHSTRVGAKMRETVKNFSKAKNILSKNWISAKEFDPIQVQRQVFENEDYIAHMSAYGNRLLLSQRSQFFGGMVFAVCISFLFWWINFTNELTAHLVSQLIIFFVFLRIFFSGLTGLFTGIQMLNALTPYFVDFLLLDPRISTGFSPDIDNLRGYNPNNSSEMDDVDDGGYE